MSDTNSVSSLRTVEPPAKLVDVKAVAGILGCSTRQVYRLSDAGKMPPPIRIGKLVRWNVDQLSEWISADCPAFRK